MNEKKYKSPQFLLFRLSSDDVIRTSGSQGGNGPSTDNNWDSDIGEWDPEM